MTKEQIENIKNRKIEELINYGYSKEISEQAFEKCVEFWQKELKCDRATAIIKIARDSNY